jgi:hypothetical protein
MKPTSAARRVPPGRRPHARATPTNTKSYTKTKVPRRASRSRRNRRNLTPSRRRHLTGGLSSGDHRGRDHRRSASRRAKDAHHNHNHNHNNSASSFLKPILTTAIGTSLGIAGAGAAAHYLIKRNYPKHEEKMHTLAASLGSVAGKSAAVSAVSHVKAVPGGLLPSWRPWVTTQSRAKSEVTTG